MKKVGIIGCGNIAQVHGWVLQNMENVELAAFCDVDGEKAKKLSEKCALGKGKIYTDWMEVCKSELDVIHICTPHYLHVPMAIEGLKCGKSVFVEKPCAINDEEFIALKLADSKYPGKLGFCFQNRYNETTIAIEKMIEEDVIGEVIGARAFVTWRRDEDYYVDSDWKGKWSTEGGGVLINQSIHTLDLLLHFLGNPIEVRATMANHHLEETIQVEDTVEAWLDFPDGKRGCFYASNGYVTDAPVILELQGEKGRITMNGSQITVWTPKTGFSQRIYEQKQGIGKGYWGCGHEACIRDFYKCLVEDKVFCADIKGVKNTFETMLKMYETAGKK